MLEIKQLKSYKLPRYPQGFYYTPKENHPWNLVNTSIASAALLALLGCSQPPPIGLAGPPPIPPDYVTEREARTIINQTFAKNGVQLDEDIPYSFASDNHTVTVELDGFNGKLNIGYEYITGDGTDDWENFIPGLIKDIDKNRLNEGAWVTETTDPSIMVIEPVIKRPNDEEYLEGKKYLERTVQYFIQYLRKSGVI